MIASTTQLNTAGRLSWRAPPARRRARHHRRHRLRPGPAIWGAGTGARRPRAAWRRWRIDWPRVPLLPGVRELAAQGLVTGASGATGRLRPCEISLLGRSVRFFRRRIRALLTDRRPAAACWWPRHDQRRRPSVLPTAFVPGDRRQRGFDATGYEAAGHRPDSRPPTPRALVVDAASQNLPDVQAAAARRRRPPNRRPDRRACAACPEVQAPITADELEAQANTRAASENRPPDAGPAPRKRSVRGRPIPPRPLSKQKPPALIPGAGRAPEAVFTPRLLGAWRAPP